MEPRISQKQKWTSLPKEYLDQIEQICSETFAEQSKGGKFVAEGRIYPTELLFRLGFWEKGRITQVNFEVSIQYNSRKDNAKELLFLALDCAASWMDGYFANGETDEYPRQWKSFRLEGREVYFQFSTVNTKLEAEADKILGESADDLVQNADADDTEDREAVKQMLGLGDDDDDDDSEGGGTLKH